MNFQKFGFLNKKLTFVLLCNGGEDNLFRFHRNLILWSGQDFGDFSRGSVFLRRHLSISRNYFFRVFQFVLFCCCQKCQFSIIYSKLQLSKHGHTCILIIVKRKKNQLKISLCQIQSQFRLHVSYLFQNFLADQ